MDILKYTVTELSKRIGQKEISAVEAVEAVFQRIEKKDDFFNCYNYVDKEKALRRAREVQDRINRGELKSAVAGVPFAVKDNICVKDMPATCSSKMLKDFIPSYSATIVEVLEKAGAIVIGKTNMDEFAMGSTTETSYYGTVKNPYNIEHVAGGSSGGSAAAVATEECFFALGSDTGGSIRQPAGYCGVIGIKPTYSRVSRYGLIAYASSFDQIGPICKDVKDCANILKLISGYDKRDSTSANYSSANLASMSQADIRGMRIGIPRDYFEVKMDEEVRISVLKTVEVLKEYGAKVEEFDLGYANYVVPTYYTIAMAEASSNLERFDGVKYGYRAKEYKELHEMYKKSRSEGFGAEVKRRIMMGSFVLSSGYYEAYYLKALKVRELIKRRFDEVFEKYDVILTPISPTTAPLIGKSLNNPIEMYNGDIFTVPANLAGLPAISVPCGKNSRGLPIGVQFMSNCFDEEKLIKVAGLL